MIRVKVFEGEYQKNPAKSMYFIIVFFIPYGNTLDKLHKYYFNFLQTIYQFSF